MGDYSHTLYVPDRKIIDSVARYNRFGWSIYPGNYESRSYSQPLIVDKTKFIMGDARYYSKVGNIPERKTYRIEVLYPKNVDEPKLPQIEYFNWRFANERSKKEGLDTVYSVVDIRKHSSKNAPSLILLGNPNAVDASRTFLAVDTSASGYRLPFEEEWFFLMRAGASTRYYWGDAEDSLTVSRYAWVNPIGLRPVAQLRPNKFGLYDMVGITDERAMGYYSYTVSNGAYHNYYDLVSSLGSKFPECHFMSEIGTVVQRMKMPSSAGGCKVRRDGTEECEKIEQKPRLTNEKANLRGFRFVRKTPKLHKLDKF
jgi:hypothetical protein